jgi:acyl-CoA thioester hydrolase
MQESNDVSSLPSTILPTPAVHGDLRFPAEAWQDALTVRSYETGRDSAVRPGEILRYLENLATRASAGLGFDNRWYRERGVAWVVREMSLLLGAPVAIDDKLRLATWVAEFRRVQAARDYLITRADSGRLVARAQARWAYIDRQTGRPERIPEELSLRMGPWGYDMLPRPARGASEGLKPTTSVTLTAREYEADTNGHINNCVYLDWFHEAALQTLAPGGYDPTHPPRARFVWLEYIRPTLPGDALTIQTTIARQRSRGRALWQWLTPAAGGEPLARAWSEWLELKNSSRL